MSLVPFLVVTFGAAAGALIARGYRRLSLAIGLLGLVAATIAALAIVPGDRLAVGPGRLEATEFGRLFLALGCSTGLIIALIGLATAWQICLRSAQICFHAKLSAQSLALPVVEERLAACCCRITSARSWGKTRVTICQCLLLPESFICWRGSQLTALRQNWNRQKFSCK